MICFNLREFSIDSFTGKKYPSLYHLDNILIWFQFSKSLKLYKFRFKQLIRNFFSVIINENSLRV